MRGDGAPLKRTTITLSPKRAGATDIPIGVLVNGSGSTPPTWTVALYVDGGLFAQLPLVASGPNDAVATTTIGPLPLGSHVITAVYGGSTTHAGSSGEIELRVR